MTPHESSALIDSVGGPAKLASILGIKEGDGWRQRVNNWRNRGIPASVELAHYRTFQRLKAQAPKPRKRS